MVLGGGLVALALGSRVRDVRCGEGEGEGRWGLSVEYGGDLLLVDGKGKVEITLHEFLTNQQQL